MESKPLQVIEYANPQTLPPNSDESTALRLGVVAAVLLVLSASMFLPDRRRVFMGLAPLCNLLGLIAGGVGWGLSKHSRPNGSHRLCAWVNTLNWIGFLAYAFYVVMSLGH